MAMSKTSMKNKIKTKLEACNVNFDASAQSAIDACLEALCDGIIEEITENMEIDTTVTIPNGQSGTDILTGTGEEVTIQ